MKAYFEFFFFKNRIVYQEIKKKKLQTIPFFLPVQHVLAQMFITIYR